MPSRQVLQAARHHLAWFVGCISNRRWGACGRNVTVPGIGPDHAATVRRIPARNVEVRRLYCGDIDEVGTVRVNEASEGIDCAEGQVRSFDAPRWHVEFAGILFDSYSFNG
jgi:hypothetical protein